MSKIKTILLTGFEPFGGNSYNPSGEIARQLDGSVIEDYIIKGFVLPVDTSAAPLQLAHLIETEQPIALVSLGLAFGRDGISLERVAINLKDWTTPDNAGQLKSDEPIDPRGPTAYLSTLPLRPIKANLAAANIPGQLSNTAGLYLCNQLMYCGLHLVAMRQLTLPCGFIHLPATPEMIQAANKPETPAMPLDLQLQAVQIILQTVALSVYAQASHKI